MVPKQLVTAAFCTADLELHAGPVIVWAEAHVLGGAALAQANDRYRVNGPHQTRCNRLNVSEITGRALRRSNVTKQRQAGTETASLTARPKVCF